MNNLTFSEATLTMSAGFPSQFPADARPQIAFSGRSNVGKSSLINTLLGRKALARVSATPGKTITVNFYNVDGKLYFVDLPGYGFAKRPAAEKAKWSALTDGYFVKNPNIDRLSLVVQLIDSRIGPTNDDLMMIDFLRRSALPFLLVATKSDKLNTTERKHQEESLRQSFPDVPVLFFSSLKKEGKEELRRYILDAASL